MCKLLCSLSNYDMLLCCLIIFYVVPTSELEATFLGIY